MGISLNECVHYQILDVSLTIESDTSDLIKAFDIDYGAFRVPNHKKPPALKYYAEFKTNSQPGLYIHDQWFSLQDHPAPIRMAYHLILEQLFYTIQSFLVIHAGVITHNHSAIVITGPPGAGKSTLVTALYKRGYQIFSDEYCPIHIHTNLVHPFPRTIWLSKRNLSNQASQTCMRHQKEPYTLTDFHNMIHAEPIELSTVICLTSSMLPTKKQIIVYGKRHVDRLIKHLKAMPGISIELTDQNSLEWRITYYSDTSNASQIQRILSDHRDLFWHAFQKDYIQPDFTRPASMKRFSIHETAFFLMRDLKNTCYSINKPHHSSIQTMADLCDKLKNTHCYKMIPGTLQSMCDLIISLKL